MIRNPTSIALVEDDPSLRNILAETLDGSPDWELAEIFATAEAALLAIPAKPPKVVLMDIQLPGMSGIECVARLKKICPDLQVMMVTVYDNNDRIFEALAAGANGYLLKRDVPDKLIQSLEELLHGGSPMSGAIARKVVQHFRRTPPSENQDHNLTPREAEILNHLVNGSLYKEIALDVGIGYETVKTHVRRIYSKLQVRSRTEAVVKYLGRD